MVLFLASLPHMQGVQRGTKICENHFNLRKNDVGLFPRESIIVIIIPHKEIEMASKKPSKITVSQGGAMSGIVTRIKLILRLMGDRRVNLFLKLLPIGAVAYLFSPVDLVPGVVLPVIGVLDDAAVLWIGTSLFVELCPPEVVAEHQNSLQSNVADTDDVIDAESTDVDE
jgi:uncharacterized membrane protein YkvA (DUF1232 family)